MKRFMLIIFTAICIFIIAPYKLHAFDITVGATTWYAKWDGKYEKEKQNINEHTNEYNISTDPAFLYGPAMLN